MSRPPVDVVNNDSRICRFVAELIAIDEAYYADYEQYRQGKITLGRMVKIGKQWHEDRAVIAARANARVRELATGIGTA